MDAAVFQQLCFDRFSFLVTEYDCGVTVVNSSWPIDKIAFVNQTTAIFVVFERLDQFIYVNIAPAFQGVLPTDYEGQYKNHFYLDTLLHIRSPGSRLFPSGTTGRQLTDAEIDNIITISATALRAYASDVLLGDFTVLHDIEKYLARHSSFP